MFLTRPVAVVLMLMTFFIIGKSVLATGRQKVTPSGKLFPD